MPLALLPVRYRLSNGHPLISVTQVLGICGRIDDRWFTPESAWRGSRVHALTEDYDAGRPLKIEPGLEGYLEAYVRFLSTVRPVYAKSEVAVTSQYLRVGGRIDRVCADFFGAAGLLDFKSGDPQPWHGQQLAAYNALHPTGARWGCYLRADGKYKVIQYADPADHRRFMRDLADAKQAVIANGNYWRAA